MTATAPKTVLVVDDEDMVRFVAVAMFEDLGLEVLQADSGQQALRILEQRPDIALLFTDYRMPGMIGPELARAAAARFPKLKIVLVSGYVDLTLGGDWPLVSKPYGNTELEQIVAEVRGQ